MEQHRTGKPVSTATIDLGLNSHTGARFIPKNRRSPAYHHSAAFGLSRNLERRSCPGLAVTHIGNACPFSLGLSLVWSSDFARLPIRRKDQVGN